LSQQEGEDDPAAVAVRPKGSGERSPGLRPKANALGKRAPHPCGLKGRETVCPATPVFRRPARDPRNWILTQFLAELLKSRTIWSDRRIFDSNFGRSTQVAADL